MLVANFLDANTFFVRFSISTNSIYITINSCIYGPMTLHVHIFGLVPYLFIDNACNASDSPAYIVA